jgi:PPOX class probable F420-dependent enzyme
MQLDEKTRGMLASPRVYAFLGTVYKDGRAHVNPMWIDAEGDSPTFNSAIGRVKVRHLARDERVTVTLVDLDEPYAYVEMHGRVRSVTGPEAEDHIDRLAKKYLDADVYPWRQADEDRIKFFVDVESIAGM